jgi:hypothetical protein
MKNKLLLSFQAIVVQQNHGYVSHCRITIQDRSEVVSNRDDVYQHCVFFDYKNDCFIQHKPNVYQHNGFSYQNNAFYCLNNQFCNQKIHFCNKKIHYCNKKIHFLNQNNDDVNQHHRNINQHYPFFYSESAFVECYIYLLINRLTHNKTDNYPFVAVCIHVFKNKTGFAGYSGFMVSGLPFPTIKK